MDVSSMRQLAECGRRHCQRRRFSICRRVLLHPLIDCGVVDHNAALGHHRFKSAVADRVSAVPAHRPEDDLAAEVASLENVHTATLSLQPMHTVHHSGRSLQQSL